MWYSVDMSSFAAAISEISCDAMGSGWGDCSFVLSPSWFISIILLKLPVRSREP